MTTPNDFQIVIETAGKTLTKHTSRLTWALLIIEVVAVCYTLPHNAHAFGLGSGDIISNIFGFLGLATLELAFLFSAYHFTKGLLTTHTQTTWAKRAFWSMFTILVLNSTVSQIGYYAEGGVAVSPVLDSTMWFYKGFILPSTPIVALALVILLIANHPKTQEAISQYKHIAETMKAQQAAELEEKQAVQSVQLARVEAKKLHAEAEAEQISVHAADEIAALKLQTEIEAKRRELEGSKQKAELDNALAALEAEQAEAEQKREFAATVANQTQAKMREKVTDILQSDDLREVIEIKAGQQVAKALDIAPNSALGKKLSGK